MLVAPFTNAPPDTVERQPEPPEGSTGWRADVRPLAAWCAVS